MAHPEGYHPDMTDEEVFKLYEPLIKKAQRDSRRVRGYVGASYGPGKTGALHWKDSTFPNGERNTTTRTASFTPNDPIRKRSPQQRTESMANRLWESIKINPQLAPVLLKYVHEEAWREGLPVTYEQVKEAAVEILRRAARKQELAHGVPRSNSGSGR